MKSTLCHSTFCSAIPTTDLQGVYEGMNVALADGLSVAKFDP